jgi:hypothetical protein
MAEQRPLYITLSREAVLRGTLKSLDTWRDEKTGELLTKRSRDRALFELMALRAYLEGQGIDRRELPALDELGLALSDAQRGKAHPMLTPTRPQDPRPGKEERKKSGAPSLSIGEAWRMTRAAVAVSVLLFHGYRLKQGAELVSGELRRRGVEIKPQRIISFRDDLDCKKHKGVAQNPWLEISPKMAAPSEEQETSWVQKPESEDDALRELPSMNIIAQRHYDGTWPFAEQYFLDLKVQLGATDIDAAWLAAEWILDFLEPRPGGKLSNRAQNILPRLKAERRQEPDIAAGKSLEPSLFSIEPGDDHRGNVE